MGTSGDADAKRLRGRVVDGRVGRAKIEADGAVSGERRGVKRCVQVHS
jgi:hypothetical protein